MIRTTTMLLFLFLFTSCKSGTEQPLPDVKEGYIQVTGGKVWYRIVGVNKPGIPLLILHGGPGAPHDYLEPLEALADERPVIFYDQLGCGNSDKPQDTTLWTVARFAEEVAQVRSALELRRVIILGQSWGGALALDYMIRKLPANVSGLILSAPLVSAPRWIADQQLWIEELPSNIKDTIRKYEELGNYSAKAYQDAMMYFYNLHVCRTNPWPECLMRAYGKLSAEIYGYMWGPSEFTVTGTLKNYDRSNQLSEITVPTLFTCGEFDEATPAANNYYKSLMPGSEIHVFAGASHAHHLEKSAEFLEVVRDFMHRCESGTK